MIPLALVTGFLGAGKTTFLQRLIEKHRGRRLAYLVNEFNPVDVDGKRLELPAGELISVSGGSIFCRCKVTEFVAALKSIRDSFAGKLEGLIVEASGIANPKVIRQLLDETRLAETYFVSTIVAIADPGTFRKLLVTLPNIVAQVQAADFVLLNKTDLYSEDAVAATEDELRRINHETRIFRTRHCAVELDLFGSVRQQPLSGEYALCVDPNYFTASVRFSRFVSWDKLRLAIDASRDVLYRVKGFVPCVEGMKYVDLAAGIWTVEDLSREQQPELVFVSRADSYKVIEVLKQRIDAGDFDA
jgi:G3E family GTPase